MSPVAARPHLGKLLLILVGAFVVAFLLPFVALSQPLVLVMAQEPPPPPTAPAELSELYFAALGILVSAIMKGLTTAIAFLQKAPAIVRTLVVTLVSAGVAVVIKFTGLDLPLDITTWTDVVVQTLVIALSAMGFHAAAKAIGKGLTA